MDKDLYLKLRKRYMDWFIMGLIDLKELHERYKTLNKMYLED